MNCLLLKLIPAVAALLVASAAPSWAQNFEYTPYKGFNNTGSQNDGPPPDDYTPTHQGGSPGMAPSPGNGAAAAPAYRDDPGQDPGPNASDGGAARASSGDAYSPPGAYSPSRDVFSPARASQGAPPPASRSNLAGPPLRDAAADMPRIEVQAVAPAGGVPLNLLRDDARRAAIQGWRSKVADRFGPEFSQWRIAAGKHVDCRPDRHDGLICTASAQPVRAFDR
jgi:hypothetical protein